MSKGRAGTGKDLLDRIGEAVDSPAAYTLLARLKTIATGITVTIGSIAAGANIIGKVGIDQTTDGTTNRVNAKVPDGLDIAQGALADPAVVAGAAGSLSAKLRSISRDLIANIVLATGGNIIGKIGIDQTTDGTTNRVNAKVPDGLDIAQGALADPAVVAGAAGSLSAKLRSISRDLIANIVLATGSNAIGKLAANSGVDIGDVDIPVLQTLASSVETTPTQIIKTVSATGTPEALAVDGTVFRRATVIAKKAARTANAGIVYLGIGATNDTQPYALNPQSGGDVIVIEAPPGEKYDLNDWYLDVLSAGDGVAIIYS